MNTEPSTKAGWWRPVQLLDGTWCVTDEDMIVCCSIQSEEHAGKVAAALNRAYGYSSGGGGLSKSPNG